MPKPHPNQPPLLAVLQIMAYWALWLLLSMVLLFLFERLGREHYAPGDVPHGHFQILVLQEDGVPAVLGRESTAEEVEFLKQPGSSF